LHSCSHHPGVGVEPIVTKESPEPLHASSIDILSSASSKSEPAKCPPNLEHQLASRFRLPFIAFFLVVHWVGSLSSSPREFLTAAFDHNTSPISHLTDILEQDQLLLRARRRTSLLLTPLLPKDFDSSTLSDFDLWNQDTGKFEPHFLSPSNCPILFS
jgi:hypothetical protein